MHQVRCHSTFICSNGDIFVTNDKMSEYLLLPAFMLDHKQSVITWGIKNNNNTVLNTRPTCIIGRLWIVINDPHCDSYCYIQIAVLCFQYTFNGHSPQIFVINKPGSPATQITTAQTTTPQIINNQQSTNKQTTHHHTYLTKT